MSELRTLWGLVRRINNTVFGYEKPKGRPHGKTKKATKKSLETQVNEIGAATHMILQDIALLRRNCVGLENLILHYAEFEGKKDKFEKFIESKIKENEELAQKQREEAEKKREEEKKSS